MSKKIVSRKAIEPSSTFQISIWDEDETRWVSWEEQQTEQWVRKEADKNFDKWNHPFFWFSKDFELNNAAEFLWSYYLDHKDHPPINGRPYVSQFPGTVLMLAAMSVECLLKAVLFSRLPFPPSRDAAAAVTKGVHNLPELMEKVGWRHNQNDRRLLGCLSHYLRWAGRYPLPKSPAELAEARLGGLPQAEAWEDYQVFRKKFGKRVAVSLKKWARSVNAT